MSDDARTARPFADSFQRIAWQNANCCRCVKYDSESAIGEPHGCDIQFEIDVASMWGGMVPAAITRRMHLNAAGALPRECPEIEHVDESSE